MAEVSISKEPSSLQEKVEGFKEYYAIREPLSRGHAPLIILYHVTKAVLFVVSYLISVALLDNIPAEEARLRSILGILFAIPICWGFITLYTKVVKSKLHKKGYLEEPGIVLGFVEGIAKELNMGDNLTVLLAAEESSKDPEVIMEPKHLQIPFDEKMVVLRNDSTGNKFYLSAVGTELNIEVVKN